MPMRSSLPRAFGAIVLVTACAALPLGGVLIGDRTPPPEPTQLAGTIHGD